MRLLIFQKGIKVCSLKNYKKNKFYWDNGEPKLFSKHGEKLLRNGWRYVGYINGWNMSSGLPSGAGIK